MRTTTRTRRSAVVAAVAAAVLVAAGASAGVSDTDGPIVSDPSIDQTLVTEADRTVTITAKITDEPAGVQWGGNACVFCTDTQISFQAPRGTNTVFGMFALFGPAEEHMYKADVTFPLFSKNGRWRSEGILAGDRAGNRSFKAIDFFVDVTGPEDTEGPQVSNFQLEQPPSTDITDGPVAAKARATITDEPAGFANGYLVFESPSKNQWTDGSYWQPDPDGGPDDYVTTVIFKRYSETGQWTLMVDYLRDTINNRNVVQHPGAVVTLVGMSDTQPPKLIDLSPNTYEVEDAGPTPTTFIVTATITDDLSGVQGAEPGIPCCTSQMMWYSPSEQAEVGSGQLAYGGLRHVDGDTYEATVTIPPHPELGEWRVEYTSLWDKVRNRSTYGTDGNDLLEGDPDDETLDGLGGDDTVKGGGGNDTVIGGPGADTLKGGGGHDIVIADSEEPAAPMSARVSGAPGDKLSGGKGNDTLIGGPNKDSFKGGPGKDFIDSLDGIKEKVDCGPGKDTVRADPFDKLIDCEKKITV